VLPRRIELAKVSGTGIVIVALRRPPPHILGYGVCWAFYPELGLSPLFSYIPRLRIYDNVGVSRFQFRFSRRVKDEATPSPSLVMNCFQRLRSRK
jgi:hypothetical protein